MRLSRLSATCGRQTGIDPAEGKVVRHNDLLLKFTNAAHDKVQRRAFRVGLFKIKNGGDKPLHHGVNGKNRFQRTAGSERVSHVAFVGGIGNGAAENVVSRFAFCKITSIDSGAVTPLMRSMSLGASPASSSADAWLPPFVQKRGW